MKGVLRGGSLMKVNRMKETRATVKLARIQAINHQ
jgi:hypothetical protein